MPERPILRAYIDETGDRGTRGHASSHFAFAAVLVAEENDAGLRAAMSRLRAEFRTPMGDPLHWTKHVKTFSRRQRTAQVLASVPGIVINFVLVEKAAIPAAAGMRRDQALFYNFAAGMMLERILLAARDWPRGSRDVVVRFGHVRGFDHSSTLDYFGIKRSRDRWIPWHLLRGDVQFDGQAHYDGLQAADQYAGMLHVALRPDEFGNYEPQHFLNICPQIRRSGNGRAWGYGFKFLGEPDNVRSLPWWRTSTL